MEFPPINWPITPAARIPLDEHLRRWQEGQRIPVRMILNQVNQGLSEIMPMRDLAEVVENYQIMGWIETEFDSNGDFVIADVLPIFFANSFLTQGNMLSDRHDSDERRQTMAAQRAELDPIVAVIGCEPEASREDLERKLASLGMVIYDTAMDWPAGTVAFVKHVYFGKDAMFSARGSSAGEAICYAAATAHKRAWEKYAEDQAAASGSE